MHKRHSREANFPDQSVDALTNTDQFAAWTGATGSTPDKMVRPGKPLSDPVRGHTEPVLGMQ